MAAERRPSRRAAAPILSLPCVSLPLAALLLLAASGTARAFTPATANAGGEANQTGPFANPFPDAGTAAAAPGTLAPPDYRYQGTLPLVMGGLPAPGFTIIPEATLQEEYTDNVLQTETARRWDLITLLTPSLTVGANTPRLNLSLRYAPTLQYYARTPSQTTISQQLMGAGSLTVVPDTLFVNARAYATETPTNGGYAGTGLAAGAPATGLTGFGTTTAGVSRQQLTRIFGESISPYAVHRFGGYGSGTLGLTLSHTSTSNSAGGGAQSATTEEADAQFQTGDFFGRVQDTVSADVSRTQGTGVLGGAHQETFTNRLGYALSRQVQIFGELGYENISYGGGVTQRINDAVWRVGGTFTPNPQSQITFSYGHQQGITGLSVLASYALTARTTMTASYTHSTTTYLQQVAAAVGQLGVNQNGAPVNAATGLPLTVVNGALAVQNTVYRTDTLDIGLTTLLDRSTLAFNLDHTEETPVSGGTAGGFAQRATTGTASWTRALSARATASTSFSYGTSSGAGPNGDSRLLSASAQFSYELSRTVSGSASYLFYRRASTEPGLSMYENIVLIGLTKRF
jgi:uncharacterized protein (PEP-CTERM system associated)